MGRSPRKPTALAGERPRPQVPRCTEGAVVTHAGFVGAAWRPSTGPGPLEGLAVSQRGQSHPASQSSAIISSSAHHRRTRWPPQSVLSMSRLSPACPTSSWCSSQTGHYRCSHSQARRMRRRMPNRWRPKGREALTRHGPPSSHPIGSSGNRLSKAAFRECRPFSIVPLALVSPPSTRRAPKRDCSAALAGRYRQQSAPLSRTSQVPIRRLSRSSTTMPPMP